MSKQQYIVAGNSMGPVTRGCFSVCFGLGCLLPILVFFALLFMVAVGVG